MKMETHKKKRMMSVRALSFTFSDLKVFFWRGLMKQNGLNSSKGSKQSKGIFFFRSERTVKISGLHMNMLFYGDQNVNLYLILQCHYISFSFRYLLELIFIQKHRGQ